MCSRDLVNSSGKCVAWERAPHSRICPNSNLLSNLRTYAPITPQHKHRQRPTIICGHVSHCDNDQTFSGRFGSSFSPVYCHWGFFFFFLSSPSPSAFPYPFFLLSFDSPSLPISPAHVESVTMSHTRSGCPSLPLSWIVLVLPHSSRSTVRSVCCKHRCVHVPTSQRGDDNAHIVHLPAPAVRLPARAQHFSSLRWRCALHVWRIR